MKKDIQKMKKMTIFEKYGSIFENGRDIFVNGIKRILKMKEKKNVKF